MQKAERKKKCKALDVEGSARRKSATPVSSMMEGRGGVMGTLLVSAPGLEFFYRPVIQAQPIIF